MRSDVSGVGEVDERNQGRRLSGVEDGKEGSSGVIGFVDGEVRIIFEPLVLSLRNKAISVSHNQGVYNRLRLGMSTVEALRSLLRGLI